MSLYQKYLEKVAFAKRMNDPTDKFKRLVSYYRKNKANMPTPTKLRFVKQMATYDGARPK